MRKKLETIIKLQCLALKPEMLEEYLDDRTTREFMLDIKVITEGLIPLLALCTTLMDTPKFFNAFDNKNDAFIKEQIDLIAKTTKTLAALDATIEEGETIALTTEKQTENETLH